MDRTKREGLVLSTLCMDVKGAFDNVHHGQLSQTLKEMGFPRECMKWIDTFLTARQANVRCDGEEPIATALTGIPQGFPILFIIFQLYVKPLFDELERRYPQSKCPIYVDEVWLVVVGKNEQANCRTSEKMAGMAFEWESTNTVQFDDPKSELIHYHFQRNTDTSPEVKVTLLNGTIIEAAEVQR